jgi:hypothetical protein
LRFGGRHLRFRQHFFPIAVRRENGHTRRRQNVRAFCEDDVQMQQVARNFLLCFLFTVTGFTQSMAFRPPQTRRVEGTAAPPGDEGRDRLIIEMSKKANMQRQAAIKSDTEKLLKLAEELKQYVDKTNENTLSVDVLKKAEEIEKLAHSVKEKMKGPN